MSNTKPTLKSLTALAVLAAAFTPCAAFAASTHVAPSMNAFFGKAKMVHFNLRNQSGAPIELRAGDQVMTIANGKTAELKLPAGTQVVNTTKNDKREAGAVVCQATSDMNDTTVVLN